jgi:hypothetical protein
VSSWDITGATSIGLTSECVTVVAKSRYSFALQLLLDLVLKLHGRPLDSVSSMWLSYTHKVRLDPFTSGKAPPQKYLNTGSWLSRLALSRPEELTPEVVAWLRKPTREHIPLRDVPPRCTFALIQAGSGGPSNASLCLWEGGGGAVSCSSPECAIRHLVGGL